MKIVIDRLEDGCAVCELPDKRRVNLPLNELPPGAREGYHYVWKDGEYRRDIDAENEARARNRALQESLFQDDE